jgi:hypothetical protein
MCEEGGEVVVWWIESLSVEGEGRKEVEMLYSVKHF